MDHSILLLEDDPLLGEGLVLQLQLASYTVRWCKSVREGIEAFDKEGPFDLALLDVSLPDGSGFDLCERIRAKTADMPVLFLTARTDEDSVVKGFETGANDYVRKPFGNRELVARLKNLIPSQKAALEGWKFAGAVLLKGQRKLVMDGVSMTLNRREYEILSCLFQNPERIVSRERLVTEIDKDGEIFDRTIDSHVSHIRSKLKKAGLQKIRIESVYGEGYRLGSN